MNNLSTLTADTRLADLLTDHPFLKDALPLINPKFKLLGTPLGKVMMKQATLAEMSRRSGMNLSRLIHAIEASIRQHQ